VECPPVLAPLCTSSVQVTNVPYCPLREYLSGEAILLNSVIVLLKLYIDVTDNTRTCILMSHWLLLHCYLCIVFIKTENCQLGNLKTWNSLCVISF